MAEIVRSVHEEELDAIKAVEALPKLPRGIPRDRLGKGREHGRIATYHAGCRCDLCRIAKRLWTQNKRGSAPLGASEVCRNGHLYTPENTSLLRAVRPDGTVRWTRRCLTCNRERTARSRAALNDGDAS